MKTIMPRIILTLAAALLLSAVGGCRHTAHGAGEDIEKMGEKIQQKTE